MEMKDLIKELSDKQAQFLTKAQADIEQFGRVTNETKTSLEDIRTKLQSLQTQTDAIDTQLKTRHAGSDEGSKSFVDELKENDGLARIMNDKQRGTAVIPLSSKRMMEMFERKTAITSTAVGAATSGVLMIDRAPGIVREARQVLKIRNVLPSRPTTMQVLDFVKVNTAAKYGSPQTEASDKFENAVTFTTASVKVQTIATWIPATRQILDDFTELAGFLNSTLPYYVNLDEEIELLSGAGTTIHLDGLITQATAFDTTLLSNSKGWNKIDQVGRAVQQIMVAKELQPTFVVLHPTDWWDMRLTKDSYGRYILGDPQTSYAGAGFGQMNPTQGLWDLTPVVTTSISAGTFLVGSGDPAACEIRDRMEMQVEISNSHSDYFVKNMLAIRAEKRLALVVYRPASYITGSFNTSPA